MAGNPDIEDLSLPGGDRDTESGTPRTREDKGDKINMTWEEGSHLKEYTYKNTGGTGKYEGTGGGGTYKLEELTDTLLGGKYKGTIELP